MMHGRKLFLLVLPLTLIVGVALGLAPQYTQNYDLAGMTVFRTEYTSPKTEVRLGTSALGFGPGFNAQDWTLDRYATDSTLRVGYGAAGVAATVLYEFGDDKDDVYELLATPDADRTGGFFVNPDNGAGDTVTTSTDDVMLCEVLYLPMWLTVANVYVAVDGSDSASDDTVAFAIYENADAGVRLTEEQSADQSSAGVVTLDVADVTLGPGMYRFCGCAQDVSGAAFVGDIRDDEFIDVLNAGAVMFGTAANGCTAGALPTTTGALTTADDATIVFKLGA